MSLDIRATTKEITSYLNRNVFATTNMDKFKKAIKDENEEFFIDVCKFFKIKVVEFEEGKSQTTNIKEMLKELHEDMIEELTGAYGATLYYTVKLEDIIKLI